ncbi:DUF6146 family protein [Aquimarina addita]|uniref:DUF6146 family protein n=1 Tax=Aquimarina addita TaxID=870485 RepID=A0ABP6ULF1_9FLAO
MKNCLYILIFTLSIYSCATTKNDLLEKKISTNTSDTLRIANDELEYEILIIEPGFNSWVTTQKPRGFYNEKFLENRNRLYVLEYNQRVLQPQRFNPNLYEQQINYNSGIHYGYEVNYMLYNYFLYFEQRYKQNFTFSRG